MTAVNVRCRAGRPRSRLRSSANRSSSRRRTSSTDSVRTRAAAISIASGRPSRRSTTAATVAGSSSASGRTARARLQKRATASSVSSSDRGTARSAAIRSGARLVVSTCRSRVVASRKATSEALASSTCSQLSRTSSVGPASSCWAIRARTSACCAGERVCREVTEPRTPSTAPTSATTSSAAATPDELDDVHARAGSTRAPAPGRSGSCRCPPGRATVVSRPLAIAARILVRSSSRPSSSSPSKRTPVRTGSSAASSSWWSRCRSGSGSTPSRSASPLR